MVVKLITNALAFFVTASIVSGVEIDGWQTLIVVSVVWGILTLFIKPILILLTLPINIITLGTFTFVINAFLMMLMDQMVPGFGVENFITAIRAAVVMAIVNIFLMMVSDNKRG